MTIPRRTRWQPRSCPGVNEEPAKLFCENRVASQQKIVIEHIHSPMYSVMRG